MPEVRDWACPGNTVEAGNIRTPKPRRRGDRSVSDIDNAPHGDPRPGIVVDHRPWGEFERFTLNEPTTVKIITVDAGHRLSLQRHQYRDELWTILDTPLQVEIAGDAWVANQGDKIWIPRGTTHRIAATESSGRFLEIAFGNFDESDIERLADDYPR
jgi:mannose-6-phosphate isomerase-like protein (cupin superfamily)